MKKRTMLLALIMLAISSFCSCTTKTKTLTCDGCGAEIKVSADSNMTEDWIIYCSDCKEKLGLE